MPKECWAKDRSDCKGGISREHYISKGIFDKDFIYVQGFDWCKDKAVKISLSSLTSKILCIAHNNELSEVDYGGIVAIRYFEMLYDLKHLSFCCDREPIDGYLFERWLLKTALNISFCGNQHIGVNMAGSVKGWPSSYLLAVVFGELSFTCKMGSYFLYPKSEYMIRHGEISITPIHKDGEIGGFIFHLYGIDVFLSLLPGHSPPVISKLGIKELPEYILNADLHYRPNDIVVTTGHMKPVTVKFKW